MTSLVQRRCLNHADREAAARCPECQRFFCRECVSEHEDRILCSACLSLLATPPPPPRRTFEGVIRVGQCALAVALIWFFFFLIGQVLLAIPSSFHEGTIWQNWETR